MQTILINNIEFELVPVYEHTEFLDDIYTRTFLTLEQPAPDRDWRNNVRVVGYMLRPKQPPSPNPTKE